MANINVTIRMDEKLKAQADELFNDFGLSLSAAITMFVKQAVREQRIPFEIKRKNVQLEIAEENSLEEVSKMFIKKTEQLMRNWQNDCTIK